MKYCQACAYALKDNWWLVEILLKGGSIGGELRQRHAVNYRGERGIAHRETDDS